MENNNYTVYEFVFPNGKRYIGLTKREVRSRWAKGKGYKNQEKVYNAIIKYGWENIKHNIVKNNLTMQEAIDLERLLIEKYNTIENGYNVSNGGDVGSSPKYIFEYNGNFYTSDELAKLSPLKDLTGHDITTRINSHKWSIEEALTKPLIHKYNSYFYKGKEYTLDELAEFAKENGITKKQLSTRLNYSWDVERAITQSTNVKIQPKGINEPTILYNGKLYNSYELWKIRKNKHLTQIQITNRIFHHKWNVEDAITKPIKDYSKKEYNGKMYTTEELVQISSVENIQKHNITDRLRGGWTVEEAITIPLGMTRKKYYASIKKIIYIC